MARAETSSSCGARAGRHQHRLRLVGRVDEGVAALQSLAQRGHLGRVPDDPAQLEHLPDAPRQLEAVEALQVLLRQPVEPAAVEPALAARDRLQLEPLRELPEQRRAVAITGHVSSAR